VSSGPEREAVVITRQPQIPVMGLPPQLSSQHHPVFALMSLIAFQEQIGAETLFRHLSTACGGTFSQTHKSRKVGEGELSNCLPGFMTLTLTSLRSRRRLFL
jgi:hypothetical protein